MKKKRVDYLGTVLNEGYDTSVAIRMSGRAGANSAKGGKGIALEVMKIDRSNIKNLLENRGYHTRFTKSPTAKQVDLVTMNGKKVVERIQCKDTISPAGIIKTLNQVKSGKYNGAQMVGTTETAKLYNLKASAKGISKPMKDTGISTKDTTRISNKLNGVVSPTGIGNIAMNAAKVGGVISGCFAAIESIINGDDIEDATANISSNVLNGALSSGVGTLASEGTMTALAVAPIPFSLKAVIGIGVGVCAGTIVGDFTEDICDEAGGIASVLLEPVIDMTIGVAEETGNVALNVMDVAEDFIGGFF